MRFANKKEEFTQMIEAVALLVSLGAMFLQIWVLFSAIESYFQRNYVNLLPSVILSGLAFMACGGSILLTQIDFFKGVTEGRSRSYQKEFQKK